MIIFKILYQQLEVCETTEEILGFFDAYKDVIDLKDINVHNLPPNELQDLKWAFLHGLDICSFKIKIEPIPNPQIGYKYFSPTPIHYNKALKIN